MVFSLKPQQPLGYVYFHTRKAFSVPFFADSAAAGLFFPLPLLGSSSGSPTFAEGRFATLLDGDAAAFAVFLFFSPWLPAPVFFAELPFAFAFAFAASVPFGFVDLVFALALGAGVSSPDSSLTSWNIAAVTCARNIPALTG